MAKSATFPSWKKTIHSHTKPHPNTPFKNTSMKTSHITSSFYSFNRLQAVQVSTKKYLYKIHARKTRTIYLPRNVMNAMTNKEA